MNQVSNIHLFWTNNYSFNTVSNKIKPLTRSVVRLTFRPTRSTKQTPIFKAFISIILNSNLSSLPHSLLTTRRRVGIEEGGREGDGWSVSGGGQEQQRQRRRDRKLMRVYFLCLEEYSLIHTHHDTYTYTCLSEV